MHPMLFISVVVIISFFVFFMMVDCDYYRCSICGSRTIQYMDEYNHEYKKCTRCGFEERVNIDQKEQQK